MVRPWWYKEHWHREKEHSYKPPKGYKPSSPPSGKLTLYYCPLCNVKSLFWNYHDKKYECLNPDCKAGGPSPDRLVRAPWYKKSRRKFPWGKKSPLRVLRKLRGSLKWRWNSIPISVRKLFLSLLVIIGLVLVARNGYLLFTHQTATVRGTIIFLAELGFLIWIISILRSYKYKRRKPSFKLVFFSLLGIALVCAFAGIEPLTSYKDRTISFVGQGWEAVTSLLPPSPTPVLEDATAAVAKVEPAVVRIETTDAIGSGMFIDKSGYMVTCNHVVEDVQSATITLMTGEQYEGSVVGRDEPRDLAIIKVTVSGFDLPVVPLGNSDKLEIGEEVIAIGYSLALEGKATVSKGVVSAFRTSDRVDYIQTDTAINPGNSGGPLINLKGEVVGIANFKLVHEAVEGMSFAVAINSAKPFIADEIERAHQEEKAQREEQALSELEEETFRLINVEREKRGIAPVLWSEQLHNMVRERVRIMEREGRLFHPPLNYPYAEIAYGASYGSRLSPYSTAESIVASWLSSPGHRAIMLDRGATEAAVGVAWDKGFYAATLFIIP